DVPLAGGAGGDLHSHHARPRPCPPLLPRHRDARRADCGGPPLGSAFGGGVTPMMLALKWALRDLRGGLRGLRLLFGCLLVGVFAIAGVGSLSQAILAGLAERGQSILGGDIEIELSQMEASPAQQAAFAALGQVSAVAEVRAMARTPDGRSQLVQLRAVDGAYPLYGTVTCAPGGVQTLAEALAPVGGVPGAAVSQDLAERLALQPGDALEFGDGRFHVGAILAEEQIG